MTWFSYLSCIENSFDPLTAEWALRALIDFTLSNARRFYSSMGNPLDGKGLRICCRKIDFLVPNCTFHERKKRRCSLKSGKDQWLNQQLSISKLVIKQRCCKKTKPFAHLTSRKSKANQPKKLFSYNVGLHEKSQPFLSTNDNTSNVRTFLRGALHCSNPNRWPEIYCLLWWTTKNINSYKDGMNNLSDGELAWFLRAIGYEVGCLF